MTGKTYIHNVDSVEIKKWEDPFQEDEYLTEIKIYVGDEVIGLALFSEKPIEVKNG